MSRRNSRSIDHGKDFISSRIKKLLVLWKPSLVFDDCNRTLFGSMESGLGYFLPITSQNHHPARCLRSTPMPFDRVAAFTVWNAIALLKSFLKTPGESKSGTRNQVRYPSSQYSK